jgi:hypothetical protein
VSRHLWTRAELYELDHGGTFARLRRQGELHWLLPGIYCTRVPTTTHKIAAVRRWRPEAVMSHFTALWLHGLGPEPSVIEAYVRELPTERMPRWLKLRVAEYGIYDELGGFGPDVDVSVSHSKNAG